ncbi:MerR family transcriptional regulator [Amycolatopsis sp. 195334CR]|uniref:helix-turn-helix domain-containing protein n=1 Tax=Amycolatopsis sp. 195334CR TaxID=2814588 RepID=UPI001A8D0B2B|nr:MerR family transcriptional regulator [Amycolatopsis sp. 195334CR]MBN6035085.1 MerR family transcriptional regulator [Amycolatopsis sp. 195334CR]
MAAVHPAFTIGELARRTGLPVKTIRFYSDEGLLPPTGRTHAGYRLYDAHAMARLELVKTLRELGLGLPDVERALAGQTSVAELAAVHVDALDEQIRRLRLRRSVLRAVAKRGSELEEVKLMSKLASMSDEQRRRLIDEFWDEMVAGLDVHQEFYDRMRSAKPDLPEDPSAEQLEAWIELAELVQDASFRALIREMSENHSAARERGESMAPADQPDYTALFNRAHEALASGLTPDSPEGRAAADELFNAGAGDRDASDVSYRREVLDRFAQGGDPRAERYWQLLAIINGWPPIPTQAPAVQWLTDAMRAAIG